MNDSNPTQWIKTTDRLPAKDEDIMLLVYHYDKSKNTGSLEKEDGWIADDRIKSTEKTYLDKFLTENGQPPTPDEFWKDTMFAVPWSDMVEGGIGLYRYWSDPNKKPEDNFHPYESATVVGWAPKIKISIPDVNTFFSQN